MPFFLLAPRFTSTSLLGKVQKSKFQVFGREISSETQVQLVEEGKCLNRREKKFRGRKVKNAKKRGLDFSSPEFFFLPRLDFFPPPLTAPGSPRMDEKVTYFFRVFVFLIFFSLFLFLLFLPFYCSDWPSTGLASSSNFFSSESSRRANFTME